MFIYIYVYVYIYACMCMPHVIYIYVCIYIYICMYIDSEKACTELCTELSLKALLVKGSARR